MPNYINLPILKKKTAGIQLYDFQEAGVDILTKNKRMILADEMGLGKTPQAIVTADRLGCERVLIICPSSLKMNWEREIEKFIGEKNIEVVNETHTELREMQIMSGCRFTIMNYEQISERITKVDSDLPPITKYNRALLASQGRIIINDRNLPTLCAVNWDMIICDEAHKLKNLETQAFKGIDKIVKETKCPYLLLLTGTPILNRPEEIWTLLHLIDHNEFSSFGRWMSDYCWNARRFKEKVAPYMLRREKKDVLTLPEKTFQDVEVELSDRHRKMYNQMRDDMFLEFEGMNLTIEAVCALAQIIRLKQLAISTDLMDKTSTQIRGAKIDALDDIIEGAGDQKIVVFSQYSEVIKRLFPIYEERGLEPARLIGDDNLQTRQYHIDRFQNDPNCKIFMATTQAGGLGVTLTAGSIAVFTDLMWTPANNGQAADRLHRVGQKNNVTIITLTALNTIEHWIQQVLNDKEKMFNTMIPVSEISGIIKQGIINHSF